MKLKYLNKLEILESSGEIQHAPLLLTLKCKIYRKIHVHKYQKPSANLLSTVLLPHLRLTETRLYNTLNKRVI